ncbi:hypothetical protein D3C74_375800 [compost metagenome]
MRNKAHTATIATESLFSGDPSAQGFTITKDLHRTKTSANSFVAAVAVSEEINIHTAIHSGINTRLVNNWPHVWANNRLLLLAAGRQYPMPFAFWTKGFTVRTHAVPIVNRVTWLSWTSTAPCTGYAFL